MGLGKNTEPDLIPPFRKTYVGPDLYLLTITNGSSKLSLQIIFTCNRTNLFEWKIKTSTSCPNQMANNIFEYVRETLKEEDS